MGLFALPNLQSRMPDGVKNENANAQGSRDLNLIFVAFKRPESSSLIWPPDKFEVDSPLP
jgi:hypothetical protein